MKFEKIEFYLSAGLTSYKTMFDHAYSLFLSIPQNAPWNMLLHVVVSWNTDKVSVHC